MRPFLIMVMALCALRMRQAGTLKGNALVATVMSNFGLEIAMREAGINLLRTDVGDRHVVEAMRRHGYSFGGEQSGHLVFLDHATTGDGVLAALQVVAIAVREGQRLSTLAQVMQPVPQVLINLAVRDKPPIASLPAVSGRISAAEQELAGMGRVLVRYSGTERKCRVMVEGADESLVRAHAQRIADSVVQTIGA
mgnify:CR=1 FL=1